MRNVIMARIMNEYNIIEVSKGYFRTKNGRAYIEEREFDYHVIAANGNSKGTAASFARACIIANNV